MRNSSGLVVQFRYGDDGLDPANMEDVDRPMDFMRVLTHCQVWILEKCTPGPAHDFSRHLGASPWTAAQWLTLDANEPSLLPYEILERSKVPLEKMQDDSLISLSFQEQVRLADLGPPVLPDGAQTCSRALAVCARITAERVFDLVRAQPRVSAGAPRPARRPDARERTVCVDRARRPSR